MIFHLHPPWRTAIVQSCPEGTQVLCTAEEKLHLVREHNYHEAEEEIKIYTIQYMKSDTQIMTENITSLKVSWMILKKGAESEYFNVLLNENFIGGFWN